MPAAAAAAALLIRALGATWRIDQRGLEAWDREAARGGRCIFAFWHARMLPLAYTHRGRDVVVLVSRHRGGEWIARVIERLGMRTARGSSTRGGEQAMRELMAAAGTRSLAITPDGPRGPAERIKPGLVWLASRSGLPVVPITAAADRAHVFRSWDRFRLPLRFARVVAACGVPIHVPRDLDGAGIEQWCRIVEDALAALTREVANQAREREAAPA